MPKRYADLASKGGRWAPGYSPDVLGAPTKVDRGVLTHGGLRKAALVWRSTEGIVIVNNGKPVSANLEKFLAVARAAWIAADGRCDPRTRHCVPGCNHSKPIPYTYTQIAQLMWGKAGDGYTADVKALFAEANLTRVQMRPSEEIPKGIDTTLLDWYSWDDINGCGAFEFSKPVAALLAIGAVQMVEIEAIRVTYNAFTLYAAVMAQYATARLKPGDSWSFAITGPDPSIPLSRLGKAGMKPWTARKRLETECERINQAALGHTFRIVDRAKGDGYMVEVTRRSLTNEVPGLTTEVRGSTPRQSFQTLTGAGEARTSPVPGKERGHSDADEAKVRAVLDKIGWNVDLPGNAPRLQRIVDATSWSSIYQAIGHRPKGAPVLPYLERTLLHDEPEVDPTLP